MGTDVHVVLVGGPADLAERVAARIAGLEAKWSRFLGTSEVSRANANAGHPTVVSPETVALVRRALDAWRVTGGRFDPTVLGAVRRAGYDASFESLPRERAEVDAPDARRTGARDVLVDAATNVVVIPDGVGFDPGGIGKGFAADIVSGEAIGAGARGVCINLGGDVRVRGAAPSGAWGIDVLDPWTDAVRARVAIADGAVATSSRVRRAWTVDGDARHHLVDPASQAPVHNDVAAVTVVAREGWRAEVLAKAAFVAGVHEGPALLERAGAAGAVFDGGGTLHPSPGWERFAIAFDGEARPG
jgi:thiamine biosynthesis lipoprotein